MSAYVKLCLNVRILALLYELFELLASYLLLLGKIYINVTHF